MILAIDPITVADADVRALPPALGAELFFRAVRPVAQVLLYGPGATWDRYRMGQLPVHQARIVTAALDAYLATLPEFARLCVLGLAHDGHEGGPLAQKILTARGAQEEPGVLEAFWQIASRAAKGGYTVVSFGGTTFGGPFLLRRSRLMGLTPSIPIPLGRYRTSEHFDLARVLSNWTREYEFSLDLWASRYGVPGCGEGEVDTAEAIRSHMRAGQVGEATALAQARLGAIHTLYQRLAPAYAA